MTACVRVGHPVNKAPVVTVDLTENDKSARPGGKARVRVQGLVQSQRESQLSTIQTVVLQMRMRQFWLVVEEISEAMTA